MPKPRKLSTQPRTSTPVSKSSKSSSPTDNDKDRGNSPDLSPVHQVDQEKTAPLPLQRKLNLSNGGSNSKSDKLYTIKERMQKIYDDDLSDDMTDSEKKLSFDEVTDDEKQDSVYDSSGESITDDSEMYSEHLIKRSINKIPEITILISYLSLKKEATVLNDSTVKLLYVEYQFLNYPIEELETPVSLPKKSFPDKIEYNYKKVFTLEPDNLEKWSLLSKMFSAESPESSLIKFTVVSEPPPEEQDLECDDIGYGHVDLHEILKEERDKIQEEIPIYDAREPSTIIGVLNVSVQAFEALLLMKTFASLEDD